MAGDTVARSVNKFIYIRVGGQIRWIYPPLNKPKTLAARHMKFLTIVFLFTVSINTFGQQIISYEQKAFDYYRNNILTEHPLKKRATFYSKIETVEQLFSFPRCLENINIEKWSEYISMSSKNSKIKVIDATGDKRFKHKKNGKGSYPRVFLIAPFSNDENQIIVTIIEVHRWHGKTYHIEMDKYGQVIKWCSGGWMV
ncbi:MAG: hypothetical protein KIT51_04805 [Cyclobacteriaceae bacterium]|nr:MAG: hypothetical protein KIT51_04805 [Cyclobacteriaceae bacterium]